MGWFSRQRKPDAVANEADAERRARELCVREGVLWKEPVRVRRKRGRWVVWTNAGKIGGNVEVVIDARTGEARRRWGPVSR
jgi:hypothetical protein